MTMSIRKSFKVIAAKLGCKQEYIKSMQHKKKIKLCC